MKSYLRRSIAIALVVFSIPFTSFAQATVQNIVNQVNQDTLMKFVKQLSGVEAVTIAGQPYTIVSRHKNNASNNMAGNYIQEVLQGYGMTTTQQSFSTTGKNIIGVKTGTQFPNQKYIICAHFDDMPSGTTAPGADDNASGTAAVMEAARIMSQYNFPYTIVFALWDEEEQGLVGSAYYANQASLAGDSILGVINMDMIAYDANNDNVANLHVRAAAANSLDLYNKMVELNTSLAIGIVPNRPGTPTTASDHASFWSKGYSAILLIEDDDNDFNAYYHTTNDRITYFNQPYFHKMSKLAIATFASFALNMNLKIAHTPVVTAVYNDPIQVLATLQTGLQVGTGAAAPSLYYRLALGGGNYGPFVRVTGTETGGGTYGFTIPVLPLGSTVEYYIAAQDASGSLVVTSPTGGSGVNPPGSTPPPTFYRFYIAQTEMVMIDSANNTSRWTVSGPWGVATSKYVSAPSSFNDSPAGQYGNNVTATMTQTGSINLQGVLGAGISYAAQWDLEAGYDYVQVLISTNNGTSWTPLRAPSMISGAGNFQPAGQPLYNGTQTSWKNELIDISSYVGQSVMLRFLFRSDASATRDGFFVDDIKLFAYTAVPVELVSFTGIVENDNVMLEWRTATETNNYGFEVEKKRDNSFVSIGFVKGSGTSTGEKVYSFTDKNLSTGKAVYRLKQIDLDGTSTTFNEIEIDVAPVWNYSLAQNYPNPFNPSTVIEFTLAEQGEVSIELFDIQGTKVKDLVRGIQSAGKHSLTVSAEGLASGTYLIRMNAGKFTATKKIIFLK